MSEPIPIRPEPTGFGAGAAPELNLKIRTTRCEDGAHRECTGVLTWQGAIARCGCDCHTKPDAADDTAAA